MEGPKINWIKNDPKKYNLFSDGSVFLVAIEVQNEKQRVKYWQFDIVEFDCDGDGAALWYREKTQPYDAWTWDDIEYFVLLEGEMPTSAESSPERNDND